MRLLKICLVLTLALLAAKEGFAREPKKKSILEWSPNRIERSVVAGESVLITVQLESTKKLRNVNLEADRALKSFVTLAPSMIDRIEAGQKVTANVQISVPSGTAPRTLRGLIVAYEIGHRGKHRRRLSSGLPIRIDVLDASMSYLDMQVLDESGDPATEGISVFVDGVSSGATDQTGRALVTVGPGEHRVGAAIPELIAGVTDVEVGQGQLLPVTIRLTSGEALALLKEYDIVIEETVNGTFDATSNSFTISVRTEAGEVVPLSDISFVSLEAQDPEAHPLEPTYADVGHLFDLSDTGKVSVVETDSLRSIILEMPAELRLTVLGEGTDRFVYWDSIDFVRVP